MVAIIVSRGFVDQVKLVYIIGRPAAHYLLQAGRIKLVAAM